MFVMQEFLKALIHSATSIQDCCMQQCCMKHFGATSPTKYCMQSSSNMAGEDLMFSVCALVIA